MDSDVKPGCGCRVYLMVAAIILIGAAGWPFAIAAGQTAYIQTMANGRGEYVVAAVLLVMLLSVFVIESGFRMADRAGEANTKLVIAAAQGDGHSCLKIAVTFLIVLGIAIAMIAL